MIFTNLHKCDVADITKDLQHINYFLISKRRENRNCCGHTLSRADNEGDKINYLHRVWYLMSLLF